jgi:hypothetical protein
MEEEQEKVPKKRGRRPKYLSLKLKEEELKNAVVETPVVKKKRGRKPKNMHIIKPASDISNINSSIVIKDLLILFLPINLNKVKHQININDISNNNITDINDNNAFPDSINEQINNYNTTELYNTTQMNTIDPFDPNEQDQFMDLNNYSENVSEEIIIDNNSNKDLIIPFKLKNSNPICFWDLHSYKNNSIILPYNEHKSIGHFCSLECAAAYNFSELNDNNVWERYSLLHYIYNINYKIKVAPSRILLNIFGGPLNIEQYRELYKNNNINNNIHININIPPLTNINMQLEITNNKLNVDNNFIPLTNKRLNEAHFNLNKTNNVNKNINTLDKCIDLINNNG